MKTKLPGICGPEQIIDAIEDLYNGNRLRIAKATLQCRIAEVVANRYNTDDVFEDWKRKNLRVKG